MEIKTLNKKLEERAIEKLQTQVCIEFKNLYLKYNVDININLDVPFNFHQHWALLVDQIVLKNKDSYVQQEIDSFLKDVEETKEKLNNLD